MFLRLVSACLSEVILPARGRPRHLDSGTTVTLDTYRSVTWRAAWTGRDHVPPAFGTPAGRRMRVEMRRLMVECSAVLDDLTEPDLRTLHEVLTKVAIPSHGEVAADAGSR